MPSEKELREAYSLRYVSEGDYHADTADFHGPIYEHCIQLLDRRFRSSRRGVRVLDYGCGWGGLCQALQNADYDYLGVDLSIEEVTSCRKRGLNCEVGDLNTLIARNESFDAIFAIFVFEHLIDYEAFFASCRSLLKSEGQLYIAIPTASLVRVLGRFLGWLRPATDMPAFGETISPPWHTVIFSSRGLDSICRRYDFRLRCCKPCPKYLSKGMTRNAIKRLLYVVESIGMRLFGIYWPIHTGGLFLLTPSQSNL